MWLSVFSVSSLWCCGLVCDSSISHFKSMGVWLCGCQYSLSLPCGVVGWSVTLVFPILSLWEYGCVAVSILCLFLVVLWAGL